MMLKGTAFRERSMPAPPVVHDAPTQPGIRRPSPAAITIAKIRFFFLACSPTERAAVVGVVSVWLVVFIVALIVAGIISYDLFAERALSPAKQAILDPRSFTPLVHIGVEPFMTTPPTATPAGQPRGTPAAARRPPTLIVIPTPGK
jgi:hypothetical protein